MINFLTNLFRKKETLLVAVITLHIKTKFFFETYWTRETIIYRCYERDDGKRNFKVSNKSSQLNMFDTNGLIHDWAKYRAHILKIPSYTDIKLDRKKVAYLQQFG